jgi:hypothetical protein
VNDFGAALRRGSCDGDLFFFAVLVPHGEHADAVLVLVVLRVKFLSLGGEPLDQTDAISSSCFDKFTMSPSGTC